MFLLQMVVGARRSAGLGSAGVSPLAQPSLGFIEDGPKKRGWKRPRCCHVDVTGHNGQTGWRNGKAAVTHRTAGSNHAPPTLKLCAQRTRSLTTSWGARCERGTPCRPACKRKVSVGLQSCLLAHELWWPQDFPVSACSWINEGCEVTSGLDPDIVFHLEKSSLQTK